jgi:hypothetical protein
MRKNQKAVRQLTDIVKRKPVHPVRRVYLAIELWQEIGFYSVYASSDKGKAIACYKQVQKIDIAQKEKNFLYKSLLNKKVETLD